MWPDQLERRLQARLDVLPKAARAELLHVLMLPDLERAERGLQDPDRSVGKQKLGG